MSVAEKNAFITMFNNARLMPSSSWSGGIVFTLSLARPRVRSQHVIFLPFNIFLRFSSKKHLFAATYHSIKPKKKIMLDLLKKFSKIFAPSQIMFHTRAESYGLLIYKNIKKEDLHFFFL